MDFCFFAFKVLFLVSFLSPQNPVARSCSKEFYNPITCSVRNHPSVKWRPSFLVQEQPSNHLLFTPLCSPYDSSVPLLRYTSLYIYFSLHLSSCGSLFFFPHLSKYFDTFFEPFQTEESELHAVFEVQLNHGFTEYLNNTLFFAIHSFPNNSKPEATFSEWSEMVSQCCHLGQCQHHVLEQKQSVQSSFYLRFFGPRVHDLD